MTQARRQVKNLPKQQKIIGGVIIAVFILIICIALFTLISRIGKIAVQVKVAPFDAALYLNGTKVKNDGVNYISPGTYTLTAEREHFEALTEVVVISEKNSYILGKLTPGDEEGEEIANERIKDYLAVEGVMGGLANKEGEEIKEKWPILKYLPINNKFYSISYAYDDAREPIILVKADTQYIDIAVQKLKLLKDVDLVEYKIVFDTKNVFGNFSQNSRSDPEEFIMYGFGAVMGGMRLSEGKDMGDFYMTTIYAYDYKKDDIYGHFRVLLKKSSAGWELVTQPQPLLTLDNGGGAPKDILGAVNSL
ncbi:MAG: hypothetical protein LBT19_00670 [Candidatus Nomurabacteria bacterium]|jgi:hypothetical protein|nr:hypothetical protein [Candidatus Nomurabacteria bacterium]